MPSLQFFWSFNTTKRMLDCEWMYKLRSFWTAKHHKQKIAFGLVLDSQREGGREWKISSPLPSRANFGLSIFEEAMASGKVNYAQQLCGSFRLAGPGIPEFPLKLSTQQKNTKTAHDVPVSAGTTCTGSICRACSCRSCCRNCTGTSACTCNNTGEQPFILLFAAANAVALPV